MSAARTPEPLIVPFFGKGYIPNRFALFNALQAVGVSVVKFQDSLIDGVNVENSDLYSIDRRPAFTQYCTQQLLPGEIPLAFYSARNLDGNIFAFCDTTQNVYLVSPISLTSILSKSTSEQSFIVQIGDIVYVSNGSDAVKYNTLTGVTSPWGIKAPTVAPTINQTRVTPGFWSQNTTYTLNQALLDINGNVEYATTGGNSDFTFPVFNTVLTGTVIDANEVWENVGPPTTWVASTAYVKPTVITDVNGNFQLVTTGGTSAATGPPAFSAVFGASTTDGGVTWKNIGAGRINAFAGWSYVYAFRTVDGNISTASPASVFTGPILNSTNVTPTNITSWGIASNIVTFASANTFSVGQQVQLNGFATSTFFNGQIVTVSATGLSLTSFQASFVHANATTGGENGVAHPVILTLTGEPTSNPQCNSVATISNVAVSANIVTITCGDLATPLITNNFSPGISIGFSGLTNATFLNGQTLFVQTATPFEITCFFVTPDYPSFPDTGKATFFAIEIYRTDDGGGIYYFDNAVLNAAIGAPPAPYTSATTTAGSGTDVAVPGGVVWGTPSGVTSTSTYATNLLAPPGVGGLANFNIAQKGGATSNSAATAFTFPSPVQVGNTIVVTFGSNIGWEDINPTVTSITDNLGNTYTLATSSSGTFTGGGHTYYSNLWCYVAPITTGGACTVTAQISATDGHTHLMLTAQECSGTLTVKDGVAHNFGSGTTLNSGTVTTANPTDVIFSVVSNAFGAILPSGFTNAATTSYVDINGNTDAIFTAFKVTTAAGAVSPTWATTHSGFEDSTGLTVALELVSYGTQSDLLQAKLFGQAIPAGTAIGGVSVTFEALNTSPSSTIFVQLLKNGAPTGNILTINPTTSNATYTLGGSTNLWGQTWGYSDFNNATWGVQFYTSLIAQAGGPYTASIRNVRVTVFGETGLSQWNFFDIAADADLDNEEVAAMFHSNDPFPGSDGSIIPTGGTMTAFWNGRIWCASGNQVFFNAGGDCLNGIKEECWPPGNTFEFEGPVTGLKPSSGGLIVTTSKEFWAIEGGPQTTAFWPSPIFRNLGIRNQNCIQEDSGTLFVFSSQGQLWQIVAGNQNEVGFTVSNDITSGHSTPSCVATPWTPTDSAICLHRNGDDTGMYLSNGAESVLRLGLRFGNWSPIYQPLLHSATVPSVGAMGSVETPGAPGTFTLLVGDTVGGGHIYQRDVNSFQDAGGAFEANVVVGNLVAAEMGEPLKPLHYVMAYLSNVGSVPAVGFLPNEIAATATTVFTQLPVVQAEPVFLAPSATLMARRWPTMMNQSGTPILIKHCQVLFDFGKDTVKNQLFELGLRYDNEQMK